MKRSAIITLLGLLSLGLVSCTDTGGPSGALLGGASGGLLGFLTDKALPDNNQNGTTTIMNANGTTTTIGPNGQVSSSGSTTGTTNNIINGTTGTTTAAGTTAATAATAAGGNTIITSTGNTTEDSATQHRGLIAGALGGAAGGLLTDQFRKSDIEKKYQEGYAKAKSDSIKEFYWLKVDAQKTMKGGEDPPLQYRYYEVDVPAHVTSDGVLIDKHKRVIEVVE